MSETGEQFRDYDIYPVHVPGYGWVVAYRVGELVHWKRYPYSPQNNRNPRP